MDRPADLRAPVLAAAAWAGGLAVALLPVVVVGAGLGVVVPAAAVAWRRRSWTLLGTLLAGAAVAGVALLHAAAAGDGPVDELAAERAVVSLEVTTTSDPRPARSAYGDLLVVRGRVERVVGRGAAHDVSTPVVLLAGSGWRDVRLGSTVRTGGRLAPADGDAAALVAVHGDVDVVAGPDPWWRAADAVRGSIRAAAGTTAGGSDAAALVPALVVGDDAGLDPVVADDFRTTGLTHLLAVSGTNLTLLVGFIVVAGRWAGVRGRWLHALAAIGIAGFVLVARTEPSVVRAAAMGTVALVAMGSNGRERGTRSLAVAVVGLLVVDPGLAVSAGFALSVLATAGILVLAPAWRDAMEEWLPRWVAAAVAVPAAAQLACTPVVTALSGEVSLVAVVANLAAAPAVAPVTVLGLAGGLVGLLSETAGRVVAAPATWSAWWIVEVARQGAALPTPSVGWGTGPVALAAVTVLCLLAVCWAPRLLRRPTVSVGSCVLLVLTVLTRPPTPGWPAHDWILAACDVGQGDALVLRSGPSSGVVVDAGPDPALVDRCLDRLGVERVPLVVLTHFHDDHVAGLAGVLDGRGVGRVEVSPLADPEAGARLVREEAAAAGLVPVVAPYAVTRRVGEVTLQTVWPLPGQTASGAVAADDGEGSGPNDASVVVVAEVARVRVLLTGDVEPPAQLGLARALPGLEVDVLKVPHHGSSHQDLDFLTGLGARLALVSVGRDNDYGHPAPAVVESLERSGAAVRRTDLEGDLLVVVRDGELAVAVRGARG